MKAALLNGGFVASVIVGISAAVATPIASMSLYFTMYATRLVNVARIPFHKMFTCWWHYLIWDGADPRFTTKLAVTGGIPFSIVALMCLAAYAKRRKRRIKPSRPGQTPDVPERAASTMHGDADWMSMDEAHEVFPGPHPKWGGIPVGEAYRPDLDRSVIGPFDENLPETWGQGGQADLLITPLSSGPISGIIIGGAGSFKTMSFTVPSATTYFGGMVIQDPSQQVAGMIEDFRLDLGHKVPIIDPSSPHKGGHNPLLCLDLDNPLVVTHLEELVDWCSGEQQRGKSTGKSDDSFFPLTSKELLTCLLADLLWDPDIPASKRNLVEWRQRVVTPEKEMKRLMRHIHKTSKSKYAADLAGTFMSTTEKTWSGIYKHATSDTKWLSIPAYANMFAGDVFDPREITRGNMTVIMQIEDGDMKSAPAVGRVIIGSLARSMIRARGKVATPVPFILDEMDNLKYMSIFETLRDQGRKSKVPLFPMWQSTGQIEATWGLDGKRSWYASAAWRMYLQINDDDTAKEAVKRCGTYTVLAPTEGSSTSIQRGSGRSKGTSDNLSLQARPLISEYDIQTKLRPDEGIIIPRGRPALRCGRPLWWRRAEMRATILPDTYREAAD